MGVRVKEWVQREWTRPNIALYRAKGDFSSITGFMPVTNKNELQRAPFWYGFLAYPSGFDRALGGFYDQVTDDFVLIGQRTSDDHLASARVDFPSFTGPFELLPSALSLGGAHKQNVYWWGDALYLIASDGNVYSGPNFTATLTVLYSEGDAHILLPVADRLFLVTTGGEVKRLVEPLPGFEHYYSFEPASSLDIVHTLAYHGYLMLFSRGNDGAHFVHRLGDNNPTTLHQITTMPRTTGEYTTYGTMFTLYNDHVYFSPGLYTAVDLVTKSVDIYRFNGASIDLIAHLSNITTEPTAMGLLEWRGELLFYTLADESQQFKILIKNDFTNFAPNTAILLNTSDAYSISGEIGMLVELESTEGLTYLIGSGESTLITSYLDLDHPGLQKNLVHLTAIVDQAIEDFNVVIEYRTDDNTDWTTAVTTDDAKVIRSPQINTTFYQVQIRITFDDQTASGNQDIRLQAISLVYSIGV